MDCHGFFGKKSSIDIVFFVENGRPRNDLDVFQVIKIPTCAQD